MVQNLSDSSFITKVPCPPGRCHWVTDSKNPDHYYCLNCQSERWVNAEPQPKASSKPQLLFAVVVIVVMLLALLSSRQQQQPQEDGRSQERSSIQVPLSSLNLTRGVHQIQPEEKVADTNLEGSGSAGGGSGQPGQRKIKEQSHEKECMEGLAHSQAKSEAKTF